MSKTLTEQEIREEIERLSPFFHDIELPYGLRTYVPELSRRDSEQKRLARLLRHFWPTLLDVYGGSLRGQRVLDIACNCGGLSVEAAKAGAEYVLGIDIVDRYLEQAEFVKQTLKMDNIDFKKIAVEEINETIIGEFDVTLCIGILYHLQDPVMAMKRISSVTRGAIVVETPVARIIGKRRPIWVMNVAPAATSESQDASTSLWRTDRVCQFTPNREAVRQLLEFVGFTRITELKPKWEGWRRRVLMKQRVAFLALREERFTG